MFVVVITQRLTPRSSRSSPSQLLSQATASEVTTEGGIEMRLLLLLLLGTTIVVAVNRRLSVCLPVCPHDRTKMDETTITKLSTEIVRHEFSIIIKY